MMSNRTYRIVIAGAAAVVMMMAGTMTAMAAPTGKDVTTTAVQAEGTAMNDIAIDEEMMIGMPSPIVEYDTLEEAEQAIGYKFQVPATITGYDEVSYSVISGDLIQVIYRGESGDICIRKGAGVEHISGDYNFYAAAQQYIVRGHEVVISGDGETAALATWTDGTYSYSIGISDENGLSRMSQGMSIADMQKLVSVVR